MFPLLHNSLFLAVTTLPIPILTDWEINTCVISLKDKASGLVIMQAWCKVQLQGEGIDTDSEGRSIVHLTGHLILYSVLATFLRNQA